MGLILSIVSTLMIRIHSVGILSPHASGTELT